MKMMKTFSYYFGFFLSTSFLLFNLESKARSFDFYCGSSRGVPTTIARTENGNKPIIYWVSTNLPEGLTPQDRCQQVAKRLQAAQDNQRLSHLSSGSMNGQPVICVSDKFGGDCVDLLFTLKSGSDPKKILNQLLDLRGIANGRAIEQGNDKQIYINFMEYVKRIPPEPN